MNVAPIALFVYNRPVHAQRTLEALSRNVFADQSDLFVFADGPKEGCSPEQKKAIDDVRRIVKEVTWSKHITVIEADKNIGLANSIINGVTRVVNEHGKVIVLEDDMVTSEMFLSYMNGALSYFENNTKVASVNAYMEPMAGLPKYFFLKGADCWGWGTWKRAWKIFNKNTAELLQQLEQQNLVESWDYGGMLDMLKGQIAGRVQTWDMQWSASVFLADMLGLWPGKSFVKNIGLDGTGTNCGVNEAHEVKLNHRFSISDFDALQIKEVPSLKKKIKKGLHKKGVPGLKSYLKKILT